MPLKLKTKNFDQAPLLDSNGGGPIDFDLDELVDQARDAFGDEGAALAENIRRNLTESVRQPRNALHASVNARKTKAQVSDDTDLKPSAQTERNTQASFETHLRAIFRRTASEIGTKLKAKSFMGIKPGSPSRLINAQEFTEENHANHGPHPHSEEIAVPIPPALESESSNALKLMRLTPKKRAAWKMAANVANAQGLPPPPIPAP